MTHAEMMLLAWKQCVAFNECNPIGSKATIGNEIVEIESESWVLNNGSPVVAIKGVQSPIPTDRFGK